MKIGIDISQIVYGTGVSNYTRNLVNALLRIDKESEYVLFGTSLRRLKDLHNYHATVCGSYVKGKFFPIPSTVLDLLWNKLHVIPIESLIGGLDVFHSSDWTQPPSRAYKVTTIHDLAPLRFPSQTHPKIVEVHKRRLEWVKKEVDKIIAVSEFTKKEIVDLLQINETKIVVIPEAADRGIRRQSKSKSKIMLSKYGIGESDKYLLVVGADPRKNIVNIIGAFKKVKGQMSGLKLIVVGKTDVKDLEEVGGVIFIGHIGFDELVTFYSGAEALVYTSLYEGFGLPILEAMQVGCPVVTSNIGAMAETAGDAAILVDPYDIEDIKGGIEEVVSHREKWIRKGGKRVGEFSWEGTAKETLEVYRQALK